VEDKKLIENKKVVAMIVVLSFAEETEKNKQRNRRER